MTEAGDVRLEGDDDEDRREVAAARKRIRARGERVCREEYQEGVTRLERRLDRSLDCAERAALAELAGRLGSAILASPLQSLSAADNREAAAAQWLFVDE